MSVPDFSGETKAFSSVVIYDRAEESSVSPGPGNGYQFGRIKLRPIGRDPFTPSDAIGLFYYVYGVEDGARVTAQYVFFLDGAEVRQTAAEEMPSASGQAVGAVEIPLTSFVPGDYRLLVRVKNEADGEVMETWLRFSLEV